jgi:hypothetical protein
MEVSPVIDPTLEGMVPSKLFSLRALLEEGGRRRG